jgi:hypothetical protein
MTVPAAARFYLGYRLAPIPLPAKSKAPTIVDWPELRLTPETLDRNFPTGRACNIGILTGKASDRLADVDLDCAEAVAAADLLLPPTGWVFGRPGRPRSHRLYRPTGTVVKTREFRDPVGEMLVELRADGCQTMAPPSTHPCGERVEWAAFDSPGECLAQDLEATVSEVAAAALLARHWPAEGSRQDAALALAGGLARAGWEVERVERFIEAVATAAGDDEVKMRVATAKRTHEKIQSGEEVTGWPTLAELIGPNRGPIKKCAGGNPIVALVRKWLRIETVAAEPADLPLPVEAPWPDPPGDEAFYGLAGDVVRVIGPASEASAAALLVQTLIAFGNVIGRGPHFTVEADRHHGHEFAVLVGKTAKARKGTSWGRIDRLFREVEEQWAEERVQSGLSSGEGLIWAVRDPIAKREKVSNGKGQAPSYVEVEADPGVTDKRLLVVEPEFANVLKQTERQGNTLSVVLRQAWDGKQTLRTMTKNSPARASGAHVSLIGHITVEELRRYLTQTEMANGYANRHLWLCVDRARQLPEGGSVDGSAWAGLRNDLAEALAFARGVQEVSRDEAARKLWAEVYGPLSDGKPGLAGALLARAEAHVMRLALLYALLDRSSAIGVTHLMAALTLWDFCDRSVYFVFGDCLGDPVADDVLRLLRASPEGVTRNDMTNYFGRHQTSDRIGRALGLLMQHRLARRESVPTGGRRAERWFAAKAATR